MNERYRQNKRPLFPSISSLLLLTQSSGFIVGLSIARYIPKPYDNDFTKSHMYAASTTIYAIIVKALTPTIAPPKVEVEVLIPTANAVAKDAIIETTIIMIATIINISGAIIFKSNLPVRHQALLKLVKPSLKKSKYPTLSPLFSFIIVIIKPYIIGISMTIAAIETKNPKKGIAESNPTKNEYPKNIKVIKTTTPHLPFKDSLACFLVSEAVKTIFKSPP